MVYRSKCAKCANEGVDKHAVLRWTLFNGQVSVVAPLCMEHGAPLTDLVNIIGPNPDTGIIPMIKRPMKVRPLEGWTKPEDD